jgi:hypothetical protein
MTTKATRSEFTANLMIVKTSSANRAFDTLQANGFKVGHNFCKPAAKKQQPAKKSFLARFF